jgi:indole-3-acetate monooxygenase
MRTISGDGERLVNAARDLAPDILAMRDAIESGRQLPEALVDKMRAAGFFELWLPEAFGGPALHPVDFLAVIEELSAADGSAGWCAMIGASFSLLAGSLDETAAREIFANRSIGAGQVAAVGKAVIVDGGYRVTGRWSYGSGIAHSQWVAGGCVVHDGAGPRRLPDGGLEARFVFVPKSDVEVIDTWRVGGLRGTGSNDYAIDDVFVPTNRTMPAFEAQGVQPGTLYRMPVASLFPWALAAVTLGVARAAIDAFVELAAMKTPTGSQTMLRDKPVAQFAVGRADAMLRAARAGFIDAIEMQWQEVAAGQTPSLAGRAVVRSATAFAGEACLRAIELVYNAAGGSAIMESGRLDRCFRDVRVAVQHLGMSTNTYEPAGRVLLGLEPGLPRF